MNWNQEELEQWALAARQKEEDNLTLEKFRRADEAKIKELTLQIEKLTIEVARKAESSNRKSLRRKPRKLSWTRLPRNSNGCIRRGTSFTCSGRTRLKTVAAVTNSSTRPVFNTVTLRAGLSARRMSTSSTLAAFKERRRLTRRLRDKSRARSANLSKSERLCKVVTKK